MASSLKHNKKRNSTMIYEFLIRRLTMQILDNNKSGYDMTRRLIEKYFAKDTMLINECNILNIIKNANVKSKETARLVLYEAARHYRELDHTKIEADKNNLIRDINFTYGKNFFSEHKLPNYRLLATIYMYLDGNRPGRQLHESVSSIQLEDNLVEYMVANEGIINSVAHDDRVDDLTCIMASRIFNERYGKLLLARQKNLLGEYTRLSLYDDNDGIRLLLNNERIRIISEMSKVRQMKELKEDTIMCDRFTQAESKLRSMNIKSSTLNIDEYVQEILLYQKLEEELNSNE